jgi:hypothetical protein
MNGKGQKMINLKNIEMSPVNESYSTNPIAPNDTTYVGLFFEKNVNDFSASVRERYLKLKEAIMSMEAEYIKTYGSDWRNVAVFNAYNTLRNTPVQEQETTLKSIDVCGILLEWNEEQKEYISEGWSDSDFEKHKDAIYTRFNNREEWFNAFRKEYPNASIMINNKTKREEGPRGTGFFKYDVRDFGGIVITYKDK